MGIYSYGYKASKTPAGKKIVEKVKKFFTPKGKVSPTIKSVKPNLKKTVKQTKSDEYVKRIRELSGAEKKIKSGKEMIKEGQKSRKKMIDTKRAFQFKHTKSTHAIKPGEDPNVKYKGNVREQKPEKRVYSGKELEQQEYFNKGKGRENKMGGGMMGRRMGYSQGKLAVTPREKQLAAQYGDKKRITRGDVITAAKKKSGEEPMRDRMKQPLKKKGT